MSTFAVLLLCIQACLIQNVFSSCIGYGPVISSSIQAPCSSGLSNYGLSSAASGLAYGAGYGSALAPATACDSAQTLGAYGGTLGLGTYGAALTPAAAYGGAMASGAAYGGDGEGNVAVIGELPVAGNTAVAGQVPVTGVVEFRGAVPAAGAVSISGQCACGCGY